MSDTDLVRAIGTYNQINAYPTDTEPLLQEWVQQYVDRLLQLKSTDPDLSPATLQLVSTLRHVMVDVLGIIASYLPMFTDRFKFARTLATARNPTIRGQFSQLIVRSFNATLQRCFANPNNTVDGDISVCVFIWIACVVLHSIWCVVRIHELLQSVHIDHATISAGLMATDKSWDLKAEILPVQTARVIESQVHVQVSYGTSVLRWRSRIPYGPTDSYSMVEARLQMGQQQTDPGNDIRIFILNVTNALMAHNNSQHVRTPLCMRGITIDPDPLLG